MKHLLLQKQCFAFHIGTVCHVWNLIFQPLALLASTRTTILTILPCDYEEQICAETVNLPRKVPGKYLMRMYVVNKDASCQSLPANSLKLDLVACFPESVWDS